MQLLQKHVFASKLWYFSGKITIASSTFLLMCVRVFLFSFYFSFFNLRDLLIVKSVDMPLHTLML